MAQLERAYVPYGAYWSSPFCRWQGSIGSRHAIELAAQMGARFLAERRIDPAAIDELVLGITVPQRQGFYGAPWLAAQMGLGAITGPTISQACATSARIVALAATEVEAGQHGTVLALGCDRTSNGPHVYYPSPNSPGGRGETEDPVWDSFQRDPWAGQAMIETAENVARELGITREEQDEVALLRHTQYRDALADDRAFLRRFILPIAIPKGRKETVTIEVDEGVHPTTAEALAKLGPVLPGGTVTFGAQTHPADGNAGMIVCGPEQAARLSRDASISIRIRSFGQARVKKGFMPLATVPAAREALDRAGIGIRDCKVIKTHNPFAVNDIVLCREMDVQARAVNSHGCPLVWGHPQAPTGLRCLIEAIELLVEAGGGYGLFTGCAAGDTAMAVVVQVG